MHIIHINLPGMIIVALAFGIAFGIGHLVGTSDEGPIMIIAGPLCTVMDASFRIRKPDRRLFHPDAGGNFSFIPIWPLGIVWFVLGIVYKLRARV